MRKPVILITGALTGIGRAKDVNTEGATTIVDANGTTVAPGFDYADYETGTRTALLASHPAARDLVTALTREPGERGG